MVVPIIVGALRRGLFFMFFRDSSRGFEMLEAGAAGVVVVMEGAKVKVRGAVLAVLGAVMVRSIVGAGVVVVAGVVSGTDVERETRAGAALTGAVPNEEVGTGWENRVKEGAGAGVGSDAGGGISGSRKNKDVAVFHFNASIIATSNKNEKNLPGSSRTFCIWLSAAFFSISRSFTVIVYPSSGGGGCRHNVTVMNIHYAYVW